MADEKVTTMVIKVDLGCEKCKKKIKKILCGIPQIQNQIYDEKANTVTVTVVCCSPEKIKKKIYCKGGDCIIRIEIPPPPPPPPPPTPTPPPTPPPPPPPPPTPTPPDTNKKDCKSKEPCKKPKEKPERACCEECHQGSCGGPCHRGCGSTAPPCSCERCGAPAPCYVACGRPVFDSWGGGSVAVYYGGCRKGCYVGSCDCVMVENPSACSVM